MALHDFIRRHDREIIDEFEVFARSLSPPSSSLTSTELRDHAQEMLDAIVVDLGEAQDSAEQSRKSMGRGIKQAMAVSGRLHADGRLTNGFDANQVIAEFRALRASVLRLYAEQPEAADVSGLARFNEAIDEALGASVHRFAERTEIYRDQFIGMLGHDLRGPLSAITAGAALLTVTGENAEQRVRVATRILASAQRMTRMIGDLLDLTRTRLGGGMPLVRSQVDLAQICEEVAAEVRASHAGVEIGCITSGTLRGEWDADRLAQVVSNLLGNAIQHGDGAGVTMTACESEGEVVLTVHNQGRPIPKDAQAGIFEPLTRHAPSNPSAVTGIGLGLFIARSIVVAHGGTIGVTSSESAGTTFEVRLPRGESGSVDDQDLPLAEPVPL